MAAAPKARAVPMHLTARTQHVSQDNHSPVSGRDKCYSETRLQWPYRARWSNHDESRSRSLSSRVSLRFVFARRLFRFNLAHEPGPFGNIGVDVRTELLWFQRQRLRTQCYESLPDLHRL